MPRRKQIKTVIDLRRLLDRCLRQFLDGGMDENRLKAIVAACSVMSGLIKDESFEKRINEIERRIDENT